MAALAVYAVGARHAPHMLPGAPHGLHHLSLLQACLEGRDDGRRLSFGDALPFGGDLL